MSEEEKKEIINQLVEEFVDLSRKLRKNEELQNLSKGEIGGFYERRFVIIKQVEELGVSQSAFYMLCEKCGEDKFLEEHPERRAKID